jgi:hypothetical protein
MLLGWGAGGEEREEPMRKPTLFGILVLAAVALAAGQAMEGPDAARVKYPAGYRSWAHVKSMVIQPGHPLYDSFGGIHHIYANPPALEALKARRPYPDGAVLVFDLLEVRTEEEAIMEGPRKLIGVMEKHSKKFAATGGWGWEGFKGDTEERLVTDPDAACFQCHATQKQADYVFSLYRK